MTEVRALRVRSSGGKYFADVVIGVDRLAGLERSHAVMDEVERVVEHELGRPAEVSVHAEPLAADEQPSERALAAALRVPGVIEVHNATVLMRPGGRAITLHARVDAGLPLEEAARITQRLRDEIRRETGATDVYVHLEPHAPGVAAAFDVTGRRADICERVAGAVRPVAGEPEEVLVFDHDGRFVVVLRVRAVAGQSVADAHALAGTRRGGRCGRRSTSSRRSWSRSTRERRAGARRPICSHAPTTGSSRRGPTASCARAGRGRPTPCSCSARRSA